MMSKIINIGRSLEGNRAGHAASSLALGNPVQVPMEEQTDQLIYEATKQMMRYIGNSRGIQGHQNSCYMDSTIFGLFALSDVFDIMFFLDPDHSSDQNRKRVAHLLWKGIVNPLRKNGVVRFESVMKMRNALDELRKMEGITEKERDPEEFLNMLFKHVLHTKAFISIRRPFGVEQEFFVQLFVEPDPNLGLPAVGQLLRRMFIEQQITFTKVPSKLLIQVPRFGREFQTYKRIVPELKLDIRELTDTYKKSPAPPCHSCGEESTIKCESCGPLSQQQFTHYCQRCSDLFHRNPSYKDRVNHRLTVTVAATPAGDPELAQLDLLSVICIETSHYVCFTRDPRDDIKGKGKWIFFDSMADRKYDRYNIPRVTDCTRELNEWVYSDVRGRDKLFSTPPRELPELVRRFTQDVYMCVYVQLDIAMYGDGYGDDDEEDYLVPVREPCSIVSEVSKPMEDKHAVVAELNTYLQEKCRSLQQSIETNQAEQSKHIQLLEAEKRQLLQRYNERERTTSQEMAEKKQQIQQLQGYLQRASKLAEEREVAVQLELEGKTKELAAHNTEVWRIPANRVNIGREIGKGGWGEVLEGTVSVAVKRLHKEIAYPVHIEKMEREMKLLAEVRHPNLVQFIGAVFDEQNQANRSPPTLITELLDMNLRQAYERNQLDPGNRLSIFMDIALALDYLHQRYDPIIHRDVSAPNVLLQQMPNHQWKGKVSDLGSANFLQHAHTSGEGCILYSAPEVIPRAYNPRGELIPQTTKIDVYSYGVLLCEVITSTFPSVKNYWSMLKEVEKDYPQFHDLISNCTQESPDNRPTMAQVLNMLEDDKMPKI